MAISKTVTLIVKSNLPQVLTNPVINGQFAIWLPDPANVRILNGQGQQLISKHFAAGLHTIETGRFGKGIYYVTIAGQHFKVVVL